MFDFFDFFYILLLLISLILILCLVFLLTFFHEEDSSDTISVSSSGSTQSKEKRKKYITAMNTYINQFMIEKLPELKLNTYIKEYKEYRKQFKNISLYDFDPFKIKTKKRVTKKVSFQENFEEREFII